MASNSSNVTSRKQKKDDSKPTPLGLGISTLKPKFAQYALLTKRIESFTEASTPWCETSPVKMEDLAAAGLVYTGVDDSVRCYHCGGGLRNWESGDDPMVEHAKWYPDCQHVLISKGKRYIQRVEAGENPECDGAMKPVNRHVGPDENDRIVFQALMENGYGEPDIKKAIMIYKKQNGSSAKLSSADIAKVLIDLEDNPSQFEEYLPGDVTSTFVQPQDDDKCEDLDALQRENDRLKETRICKICLDRKADVIFLPCGHIVCCPQCAPAMQKCPICRKSVMGLVKAIFATKADSLQTEED